MRRTPRRSAALALAGMAVLLLTACTPTWQATAPHKAAASTAASSNAEEAIKVDYTCTLADLFYSKLHNAVSVQSTHESGAALAAESLNLALIDDNRLETAQRAGMTAFSTDVASLRRAVLGAKASVQDLPPTVPAPSFSAQDPAITAAVTKLGNDCMTAGFNWGVYATGG